MLLLLIPLVGIASGLCVGLSHEYVVWMIAIYLYHRALLRYSETIHQCLVSMIFIVSILSTQNWWLYLAIRDPFNNSIAGAVAICAIVILAHTLSHIIFFVVTVFVTKKITGVLNIQMEKRLLTAIGVIISWPAAEIFRSLEWWGFPMGFIGSSQIDNPLFKGCYPIVGVHGVSMLTHLICASAAFFQITPKENNQGLFTISKTLGAIIVIGSLLCLPLIPWTERETDFLTVRSIHTDLDYSKKTNADAIEIIKVQTLNTVSRPGADLVVFPETHFIKSLQSMGDTYVLALMEAAKTSQSDVVVGTPFVIPLGEFKPIVTNALVQIKKSGRTDFYAKEVLVPFTEYLPTNSFLNLFYPFILKYPLDDLTSGSELNGTKIFSISALKNGLVRSVTFSNLICYEVAFSFYSASQASKGGFILAPSSDSWIDSEQYIRQMSQFAQVRAAESQRYLVRPNNKGITAVVNHRGELIVNYRGKETSIDTPIDVRNGLTPYTRLILALGLYKPTQY